jgi:hypothetical protein
MGAGSGYFVRETTWAQNPPTMPTSVRNSFSAIPSTASASIPPSSDKLNDLAILDFLLFDMEPGTTSFADIRQLAPAHAFKCERSSIAALLWDAADCRPPRCKRSGEHKFLVSTVVKTL